LYISPAEVLIGFDVDAGCVAYDGQRALVLPRCHQVTFASVAASSSFSLLNVYACRVSTRRALGLLRKREPEREREERKRREREREREEGQSGREINKCEERERNQQVRREMAE